MTAVMPKESRWASVSSAKTPEFPSLSNPHHHLKYLLYVSHLTESSLTCPAPNLSMVGRIPLELQETIIDQLDSPDLDCPLRRRRKRTQLLANCSLVCHHWRRHTYAHLFSIVQLSPETVEDLQNIFSDIFSVRGICPQTRYLCVRGWTSFGYKTGQGLLCDEKRAALYSVLSSFSANGRRVERLVLEDLPLTLLDVGRLLSSGFRKVVTLEISRLKLGNTKQLGMLLEGSPNLRQVLLSEVNLDAGISLTQGLRMSGRIQQQPHSKDGLLCSLVLTSSNGCLKGNFKFSTTSNRTIDPNECQDIADVTACGTVGLSPLVASLGPSLNQLCIYTDRMFFPPTTWVSGTFRTCAD